MIVNMYVHCKCSVVLVNTIKEVVYLRPYTTQTLWTRVYKIFKHIKNPNLRPS